MPAAVIAGNGRVLWLHCVCVCGGRQLGDPSLVVMRVCDEQGLCLPGVTDTSLQDKWAL